MILKSLQMQGFKSFPDKTEIRFLGGLTAIVGPNGSGKSNISDAIRWVLGEQSSRSLRGAKMEDVIFGGTVKRGAVGFAEVSLILDNSQGIFRSEYTEIMVTRRYYRSGESEYYLNKKHCRLKDIHELFMDTGLGRDGYSIIGQGRVDEILSIKSEDRREVFEEAAGITKFRYRKEEAERKLAATEENLVRIRDVYTELENQCEPLEKQAEKAKQYLLIRDELRVLEVSLWLLSLEEIGAKRAKNEEDSRVCARQLEEAREMQKALYEKSDLLAADMRQAETEIEQLRGRLRATEQKIADHASRCAVTQANITNCKDNIIRAERESERQNEQAQSLAGQIAGRRGKLAQLAMEHEGLLAAKADLEALSGQRDESLHALMQEQQEKQLEKQAAEQKKYQHEMALTAAQTRLDGMESRQNTISEDIASAAARLQHEQQAQFTIEKQLADCQETIAGTKNKLAGVSLKAQSRRSKVQALEEEARKAAARKTDCENRIHMLREMQKDYEGFSRSVKTVMQRAERGVLKGIYGPVSSLIEVPDQYVMAVETALGAAASNIVTQDAQAGRSAIEYLKRNDGGRATFLPADTIKPYTLHEKGLDKANGLCGIADKLVTCEPRFQNIISNLLGRTVIARDMDSALAAAKAYGHRFRIVTLDGQIIQAGGAMTGGSASKSAGILARAAKLRALEAQLDEIVSASAKSASALEEAQKELAALDFDIKAIEAERARALEDQARLTALAQQHKVLVESIAAQHDALVLERENISQAREGYEETISAQTAALEALNQELQALDETLGKMQQALADAQQAREQESQKIAELITAIAQNRTAYAAEEQAATDLEALQNEMASSLTGSTDAIARFEAEIKRLEEELAGAGAQKQQDEQQAEEIRSLITGASAQRMRIEGEKTAADKQAQAQSEQILGLERESGRLENQAVQLKNEEAQILDGMWEKYELTPTPAKLVAVPLEDTAKAQKDAAALKSRMRALGNVNLDAVEEYQKLMERVSFMGEQKEDLEKAQQELYKVIEQLTVNMKEIFASEFAKLNTYFGETFREIFGGGHAELQLADTSDILNCGIDIRVSPPGKSLRTITLLSGGEKAFVAIALYFAILKVRPTPFCVLDEIEAALDDINVVRYAKYLRRLSDKTQFIAITHRRGTMEEADMLYGVTMQEHGVSKLLMLNLAEAEKQLGTSIESLKPE